MVKITYITGTDEHVVDVPVGLNLMEGAVQNNIAGIDGNCGGACACATCHVYIEPEWQEITGKPHESEEDMLDFAFNVQENSRLSCQIQVSEAMDGLRLHVPTSQGG